MIKIIQILFFISITFVMKLDMLRCHTYKKGIKVKNFFLIFSRVIFKYSFPLPFNPLIFKENKVCIRFSKRLAIHLCSG